MLRPHQPDLGPDVIDFDLAFGTGGVLDVGIEANNSCAGTLENISVDGLALDDTFGFSAAPPPCPSCCPLVGAGQPLLFLCRIQNQRWASQPLGYQSAVPSPDCCGDYGDSLNPDSIWIDVSGFQTVAGQATNQCTGQLDVLDVLASWWSGNTAVAQVSVAKVTGVAPGYTTVDASGVMHVCSGNTLYWEDISLSAPVAVQVPTSLSVMSSGMIPITSLSGCTTLDYGIAIGIHYQVLDQSGLPIASSAMIPQEQVLNEVLNGTLVGNPVPSWTNLGPNAGMPTSYTDSSGEFWDEPYGICTNFPIVLDTAQQPLAVVLNGTTYTLRTNYWSTASAVPNHGSVTNGKDVKQSN